MNRSTLCIAIGAAAPLIAAAPAAAQFGEPGATPIREKVVGAVIVDEEDEDAVVPEGGDQIGAFFEEQLVGKFTFSGNVTDFSFEITVFGDNPETEDNVEGPEFGDLVSFRFFDSSTNMTLDMTAVNANGEDANYIYQGEEVPEFPIELPGLDLTPTQNLDLRILGEDESGGGGGGDGDGDGEGGGPDLDVNGDGRVDDHDVAAVLTVISGNSLAGDNFGGSADVTGDEVVNIDDAVMIMRNK